MLSGSRNFPANADKALHDEGLQSELAKLSTGFVRARATAAGKVPEFEALRDRAKAIKDHTLAHLDLYLERFEQNVRAQGGQVHWAEDAAEARQIILGLCQELNAKTVTKGKTMVAEEIGLNAFLEDNGIEPVETDLGEYIIQLRKEAPSHIIAPAIHVTTEQVRETFRMHHHGEDPDRLLDEPRVMLAEARRRLRKRFAEADIGITGANFLVAETGSSVIVTNEGNGDLTQTLPKAHIAIATLEKVVPTLEDLSVLLRVLARSATGQEMSVYTTLSTGPKRAHDPDGPAAYHVVLVDNGRSKLLGTEMQEILRCIRCGACMNHCPVYRQIGGHAYGWVYPGPMGAVLTPALIGVEEAGHLPNASTFCGRCEAVCPVRIPLPKLMRHWREREFERRLSPATVRQGLAAWAAMARRPKLYALMTRIGGSALHLLGRRQGRLSRLPLAGGWTGARDLPAPEPGGTFRAQWAARRRRPQP